MSNQKQKRTSSGDFFVYFSPNSGKPIQMKFKQANITVKTAIQNCLGLLSDEYLLNISTTANDYALFGANKQGRKSQDIPCINHDQKIKGTGIRRFYLQNTMQKCDSFISTQINLEMKYGIKQKKASFQNKENCCMWFKPPTKSDKLGKI